MSSLTFIQVGPDGAHRLAEPPEAIEPGTFIWCDCHYDDHRAWVEPVARMTSIEVFEDHLHDAENLAHPSYFDSTQRYEMIVFRGLAITPPADAASSSTIRVKTRPTVFFVFPGCVVTVRAADSRNIPALRDRLLAGNDNYRMPSCPEELMLRVLNTMVDRYLDLRQPLTEQLEAWQRQLLDPRKPFDDWKMLLDSRSEARKLEQLCEEQLDAIQEWRDERIEHPMRAVDSIARVLPPLSDALEVRANDVVNHIQRVLNHARRLGDSVESSVQLHFSATAHRTNEIMRTLTTITAIFMPLTLITGIFGMNFEFLPWVHSAVGFWVTLGAMLLIAAAMLIFFRARRYLTSSENRRRRRRSSRPGNGI